MEPLTMFTLLSLIYLFVFYLLIIITPTVAGFMYPLPENSGRGGGDPQPPPNAARRRGGDATSTAADHFIAAARDGNLERLRALLLQSPNPGHQMVLLQSADANGRTPLSWAANAGHMGVVTYLVNQFPFTMTTQDSDRDHSYPIHQAYQGGHFIVLQQLCNYCCTNNSVNLIFMQNRLGRTILHLAARDGNPIVVAYLLGLPGAVRYINVRDTSNRTALSLARSDHVKHLIRAASNV